MGLRSLIEGERWLFRLNRAKSAIESEGRMYDVKVTLLKGAKALAISAGAVAAAAVLGYLGDVDAVTHALKNAGVSTVLVAALVPVIAGAAHAGLNYLKNR